MALSSAEISGFESTQAGSMQDTCTIRRRTMSTDSYGDPSYTPTDTAGVACGIVLKGGSRTDKVTRQEITWDAVLRLPRSTPAIDVEDLIIVTAIKGRAVSQTFRLASPAAQGNTAMLVYLKQVDN